MSEGYTIEGRGDDIAGIVVRQHGERGFRFHAAQKGYHALDGHVFVTPAAAQRAARDFAAGGARRTLGPTPAKARAGYGRSAPAGDDGTRRGLGDEELELEARILVSCWM